MLATIKKINHKPVFGYKAFVKEPDGTIQCRGMQYFPGAVNQLENNNPVEICSNGLHFCHDFYNVSCFYNINDPDVVIYPVAAVGDIDMSEYENKACTNLLYISSKPVKREDYKYYSKKIFNGINYLLALEKGYSFKQLHYGKVYIEPSNLTEMKKVIEYINSHVSEMAIFNDLPGRLYVSNVEELKQKLDETAKEYGWKNLNDSYYIALMNKFRNECPFYTYNLLTTDVLSFYGFEQIAGYYAKEIKREKLDVMLWYDDTTLNSITKSGHFKDHSQAQCKVIKENNVIWLQSYNTVVAAVNLEKKFIWCSGTYSRTTSKHISWFARLFKISYFEFKKAVNKPLYFG